MSGVTDLVQWLRAQLDEDERIARAARSGPWRVVNDAFGSRVDNPSYTIAGNAAEPDLVHIATHDPARVLREIDVRRALLRRANGGVDHPHTHPGEDDADHLRRHHDDGLLRLLASVYADRPGYREEWRP